MARVEIRSRTTTRFSGVHPSAEDVVIRAAYKALAQRYHPDRFAGSKDEAHRRMSELSIAYEVLADPVAPPEIRPPPIHYTVHRVSLQPARSKLPVHLRLIPANLRSAVAEAREVPRGVGGVAERRRGPLRLQPLPLLGATQGMAGHEHRHDFERAHQSRVLPIPKAQPAPPAGSSVLRRPASPLQARRRSRKRPRAGTRNAAINHPAKSVPLAVEAKAKPKAPPPARTCSQQEQVLGLCK